MKKALTAILFILCHYLGKCQDVNSTISPDIIKFDLSTKRTDKAIPFDRLFTIQVDNINTDTIDSIMVIKIEYSNGQREPKSNKSGIAKFDIILKNGTGYKLDKSMLSIFMPPLKPNSDFDILIQHKLSQENLDRAFKLNNLISQHIDAGGKLHSTPEMEALFKELQDSANNSNYSSVRNIFRIGSLAEYFDTVYYPLDSLYQHLKQIPIVQCDSLTDSDIESFASYLCQKCISNLDINRIENVIIKKRFSDLSAGFLELDKTQTIGLTSFEKLESRINSIGNWIKYFDSMHVIINELHAVYPNLFVALESKIQKVINCLSQNKDNLSAVDDRIKKQIYGHTSQAIWLIGNNQSKDLQTKGSSIFTVDAGLADIWIRDLDNTIVSIPKIYLGLNIFFRSVNKNDKVKHLPHSIKGIYEGEGKLIARQSPFHYIGFTVGFTVGAINKANFDNLSTGTSILVGPSARLGPFRISGGFSFLQRANLNPLITTKSTVVGYYTAASLDFDLLQGVQKITSIFFK